MKKKYHSNPFISYLNINPLLNKIDVLRQICKISPLEILCVNETKLDSNFSIQNWWLHFPPYRRDRDNHGRGKMVFIREGLITENVKTFFSDSFSTELCHVDYPHLPFYLMLSWLHCFSCPLRFHLHFGSFIFFPLSTLSCPNCSWNPSYNCSDFILLCFLFKLWHCLYTLGQIAFLYSW